MPTPFDCPKCHNQIDLEQTNCPYCGWSTVDDDSPPGRFERAMRWVLIASNVVLAVAIPFLFLDLFEKGKSWTVRFFALAAAVAVLGNLIALGHISRRERLAKRAKPSEKDRIGG